MKHTAKKCAFTGKNADYQICVTAYNKRKANQVIGFVCAEKVEHAINYLTSQVFGTPLWPTVHDLSGNLIYHSYDADKNGLSAVVGWNEYLRKNPI